MSSGEPAKYVLWEYTPSVAGGVVACLAFSALFFLHVWRLLRARLWFCIPFVIGGLCESTLNISIHVNVQLIDCSRGNRLRRPCRRSPEH